MEEKCSLIVGSSGFIGSKLKDTLPIDNTFSISYKYNEKIDSAKHYFIDLYHKKNVQRIFDDLSSQYKLIEIYYLAGESSVENSLRNPNQSIQRSIQCLLNVLDSSRNLNTKLLFASSGSIYDSRTNHHLNEDSPIMPPSPYAAIKASSEDILNSFAESFNLDIKIVRIFSVYGQNMNRFFIHDLVKKINEPQKIMYFQGDGSQVRDYLHIDDVVNGLLLVMNKSPKGEVFNLCSGKGTKIKDIVSMAQEILNSNKEVIWNGAQTEGIRDHWYGNNTKILNLGLDLSDKKLAMKKTILSLNEKLKLN